MQRAGEVVFNPSCCVHAVRNSAPLTVSCTHNFIDATNLSDALADATRSFTELLLMMRALGAKRVLRTLQSGLHVSKPQLLELLASLPGLLSAERVAALLDAAVDGASGEERECVRGLLESHLRTGLERERPAFEAAAAALCAQLNAAHAPRPSKV